MYAQCVCSCKTLQGGCDFVFSFCSLRGAGVCRCPDEADAQALRAAVLLDEMKRPVGRKVQVWPESPCATPGMLQEHQTYTLWSSTGRDMPLCVSRQLMCD